MTHRHPATTGLIAETESGSDNAARPRTWIELDVPVHEAATLIDRAVRRLAPAFLDLPADARLLALADDPGSAILRVMVESLAGNGTRLGLVSAQGILTPFDRALACCALVDAALGRDVPALSPGPHVVTGDATEFVRTDFCYPGAIDTRATLTLATSYTPETIASAVVKAVEIWTGQDRSALALLTGNSMARATLHACSPDGAAISMRGSAHWADILICVETQGNSSDPVFRTALLGGSAITADARVIVQGATIGRPEAALTLLVHENVDGSALTLVSGRKGLPAPLADWFLQDVAAILSGAGPQDHVCLPSIRNRRAAQGTAHGPTAQLPSDIQTLWQGIEAVWRENSERTALHDGVQATDYATLFTQSLATSANLAGDDRPVGLLFDHGPRMVTAMLAALSVGRPYVPLDPDYPQARLTYMLLESGASQLLSDPANEDLASRIVPEGCTIISQDATSSTTAPMHRRVPLPDDAAYILFTSGSTGTPKRVIQTHRNVLVQIRNHVASLSITARDRVSVVSSFCFDASVTDTYSALLTGATLIPISAQKAGLVHVARTISEQRVTVWHSTPTTFRHMVEELGSEPALPDLRAVLLGGEPVFTRDVQATARHCAPGALFVNGYGATEASFVAQNPVIATDYKGPDIVPIGWPIPGFEVDLVDAKGQPAPIIGEMVVTTAYFATENAALGIPERHATNDLARFDPRTGFSYLGRSGAQIKLRGYRIDPAEIEQILARQPGIADVCVTIRPDPHLPDTDVLCAWLAVQGETPPRKANLAHVVQAELPAYMVPTYYTFLPALPLTQSGKIDRKRMPDPDTAPDPGSGVTQQSPLSEALETLFGLTRYNPQASFFDLGLTSLSLARLHAHLAQHSGTSLSLVDLFDLGTPANVAAQLTAKGRPGETMRDAAQNTLTGIRARLEKRKRKGKGG